MAELLDKTALRQRLRAARRRAARAQPDAGRRAAERLPLHRLPSFAAFAVYVAQGSEIDPLPLMLRLVETGAEAALPAAVSRETPLEFRGWDPRAPLEPDAFGIPAPPAFADVLEPDLIVAPLLGFDRSGGRLGQGAGQYDRTLANLRRRRPVFVLGLAFAAQEVEAIPREPHDERLDAILTETEFISVAREDG